MTDFDALRKRSERLHDQIEVTTRLHNERHHGGEMADCYNAVCNATAELMRLNPEGYDRCWPSVTNEVAKEWQDQGGDSDFSQSGRCLVWPAPAPVTEKVKWWEAPGRYLASGQYVGAAQRSAGKSLGAAGQTITLNVGANEVLRVDPADEIEVLAEDPELSRLLAEEAESERQAHSVTEKVPLHKVIGRRLRDGNSVVMHVASAGNGTWAWANGDVRWGHFPLPVDENGDVSVLKAEGGE